MTERCPAVAVVGARDDSLWTYLLFHNLTTFGDAEVWPVSRSRKTVRGVPTFASLDSVPYRPEVAVLVVGANAALSAVAEASGLGVPHIVLISDGFSERGTDEGERLQAELIALMAGSSGTLYGPNGVGFADFTAGLAPLGAPIPAGLRPGPVSVISQSGSLCTSIMGGLVEDGTGVDWCVSIGNGATFDVLDALEASLDRRTTKVICGYVESLGGVGGRMRLEALLARARAQDVAVILAKSGGTAVSAAIARSHTAAIAGQDRLVDEVLKTHGVVRVGSIEELTRAASISAYLAGFAALPPARGPGTGVAVIETSGGAAALVADLLSQEGLGLATFAPDTRQALADVAPPGAYVRNPIDLTASPKPYEDVTNAFSKVYADPAVGCVVIPYALTFPENGDERGVHKRSLERYADIGASTGKPVIVSTLSDFAWTDWAGQFRRRCPKAMVLRGIVNTVRALARLFPARANESVGQDGPDVAEAVDGRTAHDLLVHAGLRLPRTVFVGANELDRVEELIAGLRYPLVVKLVADGLLHKARIGGVRLGCTDATSTVAAARDVLASASAAGFDQARVRGVSIEETVDGPELFVALHRDPWFGPFLVVASGGAGVEESSDSRVLSLPVPADVVRAALPACVSTEHVPAVVRLVIELSELFLDGTLREFATVELNPVRIGVSGPQILDAVLVRGRIDARDERSVAVQAAR